MNPPRAGRPALEGGTMRKRISCDDAHAASFRQLHKNAPESAKNHQSYSLLIEQRTCLLTHSSRPHLIPAQHEWSRDIQERMAVRLALARSSASSCPHQARLAMSASADSLLPINLDLLGADLPGSAATSKSTGETVVRSFQQIPTPKAWPIVGTWLDAVRNGVITRLHEYIDMRYRQLGPIYREKLGKLNAVFLFDPKDVEAVFRKEGKHPRHIIPEAWILHRDITQKPRGLFFMDGEHWLSRRRVVNQLLLHPKVVTQYSDRINETIDDLIAKWKRMKRLNQNSVIDKVEVEMFNWSIEAIGTVLFNQRMGCLTENRPKDIQDFVRSIQDIFKTTMILTMIPPKLAKLLRLPVWNKFLVSMNTSMSIARRYIQTNLDRVIQKIENGEPINDFCSQMIQQKEFDLEEIVRLATDLFSGAADTVSNAMSWALYLISQDADVQQKMYEEVSRIVPAGTTLITSDMLKQMNYIKAVMKEVLRLYPVVPFQTRYLDEDVTIKGYNIPANTLIMMGTYSMGRDEKNFYQPDKFIPERWFRDRNSPDDRDHHFNAHYATMPFAFGPRCCVGRRLAETEMHMLLAKLVTNFKIEFAGSSPVEIDLRMITAPKQSIKLQLIDRIDASPTSVAS